MIHILDFNDNIIDFISHDDGALISGKITINAEDNSETFDFVVTNDRAEHLRERNRIIVQDMNGEYREFVIIRVTDAFEDTTEVQCNASYLEDINTARPIAPGKYKAMSTTQALTEVLANTGWEVSDETEHGGFRSTSWTAYATPYELINQLGTTYGMQASYYVELGSHTVEHRYVKLAKPNPLFKGKEIVKGKDLTGLTRTIDTSAIKTALIALGPEPESGERMEVIVKDDEAQAQFGLPNRYLWGVYEPESTDENMTKERLTTLAENELDKQKQMAITYEISSVDIHRYYQDQAVYLHDIIRVKDRDFKPALYVEAEVIGYEYDVVGDESVYTFGNIVEYSESSLRSDFEKRLSDIRKMMADNISNVNTIVADVVAGQLEYFEPKIFKQETAPDNPVEDMLWYDTSNPSVAVLRRFHNGEWINETAQSVKQLGGLTREETLFNSLTNTFQNLNIQHSQLLENVSVLQNSEYLIDTDLKQRLNTATDAVINVYQHIKSNLDGMTPETATIGNLIDTQALFQDYRERLQDLYKAMRNAQVSADKRLQLLQSQYTDEKFNDAMNNIAKTLPGGYWDPEKQQLIGDIPNKDDLAQLQDTLKQYTSGQIDSLSSAIGQQTDSKINQAKDEISASVNSVKKDIEQSTDDKLKPITTRVTDSESSIKVLQDGLKLTATKNDVQQTLNDQLEPIKNQVNQQQATLDVLPGQIASKVSQTDYDTDKNGIVGRLDKSDSERVQLSNEIKDKVSLSTYNTDKENTEKKLTDLDTSISQNGQEISLRATKTDLDTSKKTLSKVVSDFTNSVATGMTYTYDDNGAIQLMNVGKEGIQLRGDKVDITVNKDFNVVAQNLDNKVGKNEVVNRLNLSTEGLDINVNKLGIVGGDSTNSLTIRNNRVLSRGQFTRTWSGVTDTANATVGIRNGYIMSSNEDTGYNLYMSEKGLSTMMSGGLGSEQAGALEFHYDLMNDKSRGVKLSSTYGVVFLHSEQSRLYTRSRYTTNIETWEGSIYFRPHYGDRPGVNEFSLYIKDNDDKATVDGTLLYGEVSEEAGRAGSGLRFKKAGFPTETYGYYEPIVYATNNVGDIGSGSFYGNRLYGDWTTKTDNLYACVKDKLRITDIKGYNSGNTNYKDLQCKDIQANTIRVNTGNNFYLGVSTGELRVTNNLMYNGGDIGYKPVRASDFIKASSEKYKKEIQEWNYDALSVLSNELKLYSYKYKDDEKEVIHHGPVIGVNYDTPVEFIFNNGVNTNEMLSWALRSIQQLNEKIEKLEEKLNE